MAKYSLRAFIFYLSIVLVSAGVSPVHDFREKIEPKPGENFINAPYRVMRHLDNTVLKNTKNVTQNAKMEDSLYQLSKDIVSAILSKLEIQDKITRITREALEAPGKIKGITAIETRRILDYISRTLSSHILSITRVSTEPELHRLVYGLSQIAAEVAIVSALKDITYATALSKKQSVDLSLRKKRSIGAVGNGGDVTEQPSSTMAPSMYHIILNKTENISPSPEMHEIHEMNPGVPNSPYAIISRNDKKSVAVMQNRHVQQPKSKGFLNQTVLDAENLEALANDSDVILLEKTVNGTHYVTADLQTIENQDLYASPLVDEWLDPKDNSYKSVLSADVAADIEIDQPAGFDEEIANEKKTKLKMERQEVKAKKAILYAGDVAYLTAASVVAMRRALTASIEVHMSVRYAKNGMSNHQELMMNLAKTAAQQAGKEAKSATSKSLACERVMKLALKYTAQANGAKLNHVANRIVMDTLPLATLAKSMAFVSSEIAINSLYQATDVKPPS